MAFAITDEAAILDEGTRLAVITEIRGSEANRRKNEARKRNDCFSDFTKEHVLIALKKEFSDGIVAEMENRISNVSLLKKIIDKKARVYQVEPERKLVAEDTGGDGKSAKPTDEKQKLFDALIDELELDVFMKNTDKMLELHLNELIKITAVRDPESSRQASKGQAEKIDMFTVKLELLTPELYDVIEDSATGTDALVTIFSYNVNPDPEKSGETTSRTGNGGQGRIAGPENDKGKTDEAEGDDGQRYIFWSDSYHFTTDSKGAVLPEDSPGESADESFNPIGVLSCVSLNRGQRRTYWAQGGEDLVDNSILVNILLSDMYFISKYQGQGILVVAGKDVPKKLKVGASAVLTFTLEEGDPTPIVQSVSGNPPLADHRAQVEQLVAFTLSTNGLEPSAVAGKLDGGTASSGIQDLIQKSEPINSIKDSQTIYRKREPRVIDRVLKWINLLGSKKILAPHWQKYLALGESIDYTLNFVEPSPFQTEKEKLEVMKSKKDLGIVSKVDLIMMDNPDLTRDQAKERLIEIQAETPAPVPFGGGSPVVSTPLKPGEAPPVPEPPKPGDEENPKPKED